MHNLALDRPISSIEDDSNISLNAETSHANKLIMLRADCGDTISVESIHESFAAHVEMPPMLTVRQRKTTYYGPKLLCEHDKRWWFLSASGPKSELLLWHCFPPSGSRGEAWQKVAEVSAAFTENVPTYSLCEHCGKPLQTLEHERSSESGACLNTSFGDD